MKRKVFVIAFFVIVFGLPVSWYLILQVFGENQFDLPHLGGYDEPCQLMEGRATLLVDSAKVAAFPNQLKRLENHIDDAQQNEVSIVYTYDSNCLQNHSVLLVDEEKRIRGEYEFSREEVDRLLTEIDIYVLNKTKEVGEE